MEPWSAGTPAAYSWCSPCWKRAAGSSVRMMCISTSPAVFASVSRRRMYVAAALISSLSGAVLPPDGVYFGEVSLTGAVRAVPHAVARLKEAAKLGFTPRRKAGGQGNGSQRTRRRRGAVGGRCHQLLGDIVATIAAKGIAPQQRQGARGMTRGPHRAISRGPLRGRSVQICCAFAWKPAPPR